MKKLLLIAGIVSYIACALSLAYAGLNWFAYRGTLDGSTELYHRLHGNMIAFFVIGIVLAVVGTACMLLRVRK